VEILVLASGSSGNAMLICSGETSILVDVGISALQVRRRLEAFGREPDEVEAILLTHEHSDHVRGLDVFLRRHQAAPVWATPGTWSKIDVRSDGGGDLYSGRTRRFGVFRVTPVATSHDAAEAVAYVFDDGEHSAALCTDTGIVTPLLEQRIQGCELLLLETNHDRDMLRHGPYPWHLKQRIGSRTGHLSNHQSCEAVDRVNSGTLKGVVGMHLSAENNCPNLVRDELRGAVGNGALVGAVTREEIFRVLLDGSGVRFDCQQIPRAETTGIKRAQLEPKIER
jgi:phosphoribosyl 1,2-cyclic phosphodiesterase